MGKDHRGAVTAGGSPTLADWEAAVINVDDEPEDWGDLIEGDQLRTMLEEAQKSI